MSNDLELDEEAWINNPDYNYVYNKLWLCKTQNIKAGPVPTKPNKYSVFYKPIINLYSLGACSFKAEEEVNDTLHPGLFWMEYLKGVHWTIDCNYSNGNISNSFTLKAKKDGDLFKLWKPYSMKFDWILSWFKKHLSGYEGPVNLEGIGNNILEVHLRNSSQMKLMKKSGKKYCVPFFGSIGRYDIDEKKLNNLYNLYENSIIKITIENGKPEFGLGESRRLGYVISNSKDICFEIKNKITDKVVKQIK